MKKRINLILGIFYFIGLIVLAVVLLSADLQEPPYEPTPEQREIAEQVSTE